MQTLPKLMCNSIVLAVCFFFMKTAQGAELTGNVHFEDGIPLTPRFSVRATGPTTLTRALDASGNFTFSGLATGTYTLTLVTPSGIANNALGAMLLSSPDDAANIQTMITLGSWFHIPLTQPDGTTIITDDLTYQVLCKSKNFRLQSYNGVLISDVPPNESCTIAYYRGMINGPFVPPDKYTFSTSASGILNLGALRTRTPSLHGTVLDRNGSPVKNLPILLNTISDATPTQNTTTNASGVYTFSAKPGKYTLTITNPSSPNTQGYGIPWVDVTIPPAESAVQNITLREANILGIFTNRDGAPVTKGIALRVERGQSKYFLDLRRAATAYIPTGSYTIEVSADGYFTTRKILTVTSETPTETAFQTGWAVVPFSANGTNPNIRATVAKTNTKKTTKSTVGLNVHWSHVNERYDESVYAILQNSNTKWVREWFKAGTFPNTRFHFAIQRYRDLDINVVGMLAYNPPPFNQNAANLKALTAWKDYVQKVVRTYKSYIRVWEVWNEPNFIHLNPPTVGAYLPYLRAAGEIIRKEDPGAIILNGGLSWPDAKWAEALLRSNTGKKYVDRFAFHVYYCDMYAKYGDNRRLKTDLAKLKKILDKYRKGQKAWITEMGCSLKTKGITEAKRLKYAKETVPWLLKQGWIQNIFWYTTLDGTGSDPYENFFGLYTYPTIKPRTIADWYKNIPK